MSDIRVCKTCPPGTFQNIKGQKKCLPCPVNTYSGAEGLVTSAQCIKCEDNIDFSTTNGSNGVANVSGCVCLRGRFMDEKGKCPACPGGGNCDGVGTSIQTISSQPSYWRSMYSTEFYFAMSNNTALVVLLSQCRKGHTGVLCATCKTGYVMQSALCVACPGRARATFFSPEMMLLSIFLSFVAFIFLTAPALTKKDKTWIHATT